MSLANNKVFMWAAIAILACGLLRVWVGIQNLDKMLQSKIETVETLSKTTETDLEALFEILTSSGEKHGKFDEFVGVSLRVLEDSINNIQKQIFHQKHINVAMFGFITGTNNCNRETDLVISEPFGDIKDKKDRLNNINKRSENLFKEFFNVLTSEDPNSRIESISKMGELSVSEEFQPMMKLFLDNIKSDSERTR